MSLIITFSLKRQLQLRNKLCVAGDFTDGLIKTQRIQRTSRLRKIIYECL